MKNQYRLVIVILSFMFLQSFSSQGCYIGTLGNPVNYSSCVVSSTTIAAVVGYYGPYNKVVVTAYKYNGSGDINLLSNYTAGSTVSQLNVNTSGTFINVSISSSGSYIFLASYYYQNFPGSGYIYEYTLKTGQSLNSCMPTGILNQFSVNFYTSPVANFNVNGSIGSCSTWKDVYNCSSASMTLANTSTGTSGNSPQYQLLIYNYTQSTCAIGSVIYNNGAATNVTPGWTSGWPTTLNMKTLTGINGNSWFNATGYYLVRLNVRNSCNTPGYTTKDEIIKVSPSPESISASWSAFNCANTVAPSLNCNAPTAVSKYSPIIYASNTGTGSNPGASIDQYTVTIQDYSGPSCILGGVYYSHTYSWAGPGPLTNKLISLNKVIEESGGGTSWFANHFSTKVKVTISVHNVCGNSPDVIGYLTNSIECRVGSKTELNTNLSIFPNPARGSVTLHIELEKATDVNCKLIDYTGRTVQQLLIGDYLEQGNHDIYVDVSGLSRGIYFIELTDEKKQMLKLVLE